MAKPLATLLALTLLGNLHAEDPAPARSVITWEGSAFKDGDAFNVTATINEKEVQLVWDGFAAPEFDFMDDKENPRIRKEFLFKDEATVRAFRIIADQAEQCDIGFPMVIGQGVSTEVKVESPAGRPRQHLRYFGTTAEKLKAGIFEGLPWHLKEMLVDSKTETEIPQDSKFSQGLRAFAYQLDEYRRAFDALSEACENGSDLPLAELEKALAPTSLESFLRMRGNSGGVSGAIRNSLPALESILTASLHPSNRALLFGDDAGAGVILNIGVCRGEEWVGFALLEMKVRLPDYKVRMLSYEGKAFLLHFILGRRSWEGMDVCHAFDLVLSPEGKLQIQGNETSGEGDPASPDASEISRRLKYLDEENICGSLLGLHAHPPKDIAMVQVLAIRVNRENPDRAKIDFRLNGEDRVMEMNRTDGAWKPGKLWKKQDYYLIDGAFHNDADFRPEGR